MLTFLAFAFFFIRSTFLIIIYILRCRKKCVKELANPADDGCVARPFTSGSGTPRIALKLLKRVRDFVEVQDRSHIAESDVRESLKLFNIDTVGLDESDRQLLLQLIEEHNGGPIGLSTLAATLNEDTLTIEEVFEPYLLQIGFLKRTPKGRVVTEKAYKHLDKAYTPK